MLVARIQTLTLLTCYTQMMGALPLKPTSVEGLLEFALDRVYENISARLTDVTAHLDRQPEATTTQHEHDRL